VSSGFAKGPAGVTLSLSGPGNLKLSTVTGAGGGFSFDSIPPGPYALKASHDAYKFEKDSYSFEISSKNVVVENQVRSC
jgi:hypothetical protein